MDLPLIVSGRYILYYNFIRGDVEITYINTDAPLEEFKVTGSIQDIKFISVSVPNLYRLTSIHDSFCRGMVSEPSQIVGKLPVRLII